MPRRVSEETPRDTMHSILACNDLPYASCTPPPSFRTCNLRIRELESTRQERQNKERDNPTHVMPSVMCCCSKVRGKPFIMLSIRCFLPAA